MELVQQANHMPMWWSKFHYIKKFRKWFHEPPICIGTVQRQFQFSPFNHHFPACGILVVISLWSDIWNVSYIELQIWPVEVLFQASLCNCLNCIHYCDDHSSLGNFFVEYVPKLIMNNQYFLHQRCCYYRNNTQRPALVNIFSSTSYCRLRLYMRFELFITASIIKGCLF